MKKFKGSRTTSHPLTPNPISPRNLSNKAITKINKTTIPTVQAKTTFNETNLQKTPKLRTIYESKSKEEFVPHFDPPFMFMRNGVPFLYTPGVRMPNSASANTMRNSMKGMKLKDRSNLGNMFAVHAENQFEKHKSIMLRSCLTMRSKWK